MERLSRKIDTILTNWKKDPAHLPLIIKGARQIGKTESVRHFGRMEYPHFVEINFILQKQFRTIFEDGYDVDRILKNISFIEPSIALVPGETLLFFDEIQVCPDAATALKAFREDGRYDVICSGSLMGLNYQAIESNSVGNKTDLTMYSLDFEEFLWALGYTGEQIEELYRHMLSVTPLGNAPLDALLEHFQEYLVLGGMPAIVDRFIRTGNYSGTLAMQRQILTDYEEDITKYAGGLDKGRILNAYRAIPVFLGKDNKKFQVSKVAHGARSREYAGVVDWLENAGIVNVCRCLHLPELPLRGNTDPDHFKLYFGDPGILIASLDDEAQEDLRYNKNFNMYKGAIYENIMADMLVKQGYDLYFYKNKDATVEMDFFVRDRTSVIPVEVKAKDGPTASLINLITKSTYPEIHFGIKFGYKNIGWDGRFYTFPYALGFLLKKFLRERKA